jgi:hypothetical protein
MQVTEFIEIYLSQIPQTWWLDRIGRYRFVTMIQRLGFSGLCLAALLGLSGLSGCMKHRAKVVAAEAPPAAGERVLHSGRLWVRASDFTHNTQCASPPEQRLICFEYVRDGLEAALHRQLWSSFPEVRVLGASDRLMPGDYVLFVKLEIEPIPPGEHGPGWSAGARGHWQVVRDGQTLAGASVASRSRPEFAYGRALGIAAGEVLEAASAHIASVLYGLPETRPVPAVALPAVATR